MLVSSLASVAAATASASSFESILATKVATEMPPAIHAATHQDELNAAAEYDVGTCKKNYRQHVMFFFMAKNQKQQQHAHTMFQCNHRTSSNNSPNDGSSANAITMLDKFTGLLVPIHQIAKKCMESKNLYEFSQQKLPKLLQHDQQQQQQSPPPQQSTTKQSIRKFVLPVLLRSIRTASIRETMPPFMFNDILQTYLNNLQQQPNTELWLEVARDNGFTINPTTGRINLTDWLPNWPNLTVEQAFLVRCWPFEYYPEFLDHNKQVVFIQYIDLNSRFDNGGVVECTKHLCSACVYQNRIITRFADIEIHQLQFVTEAAKDAAILAGIKLSHKLTIMSLCAFERSTVLIDDYFWCKYCKHTPLFLPIN